jgi:RNA polymerase sigma factor (sigma-70 family)
MLRPRRVPVFRPMPQQDLRRFEQVVLPYLDDAYTLASYLLRDAHDAEDVVQDAVLRALRHFRGYRDGDARAWLLTIVRNCCLTWHRRQRGRRGMLPFGEPAVALVVDPAETDARAIADSDRERVSRAVALLPIEFREVIVLREIEGLSYKEIGTITGVPIGTVMSRLARGRKRLADTLGNDIREVG